MPQDDKWLDDILGTTLPAPELGPDEMAVSAAGLTHMDDMDLEKILAEDWSKVPDLDEITGEPVETATAVEPETPVAAPAEDPVVTETTVADTDTTQMFIPLQETPTVSADETQVLSEIPQETVTPVKKVRRGSASTVSRHAPNAKKATVLAASPTFSLPLFGF